MGGENILNMIKMIIRMDRIKDSGYLRWLLEE